jgi:hypothetical protein
MPKKGDVLTATKTKTRDRAYLSPSVVPNGYNLPQPIKCTILQSQEFNGKTFYLAIIDGEKPPGRWYASNGITIKQGQLQPLKADRQAFVIVKSPNGIHESRFLLDQNGVNSYIAEGFTVVLDDDRMPL